MAGPRFNLKGYDPDYDGNKLPKNRAAKRALSVHALHEVTRAVRSEEKLQQRHAARAVAEQREQEKVERANAKTRAKRTEPCTMLEIDPPVPGCPGWRVEFVDGPLASGEDGLTVMVCGSCTWSSTPSTFELERLPEVQAELARVRKEVADG